MNTVNASFTVQSGKGKGIPAYAAISASSNGANTIVAASTGHKIQALSYVLDSAGTVTATWESSGGTQLSGAMPFAANGNLDVSFNPVGHFETLLSEGLVLFLSSGVAITGHVTYVLI